MSSWSMLMKRIRLLLYCGLGCLLFDRSLLDYGCICVYVVVGNGSRGATVMNEQQTGAVALDDAKQAMIVPVTVAINKENTNPQDEERHTLTCTWTHTTVKGSNTGEQKLPNLRHAFLLWFILSTGTVFFFLLLIFKDAAFVLPILHRKQCNAGWIIHLWLFTLSLKAEAILLLTNGCRIEGLISNLCGSLPDQTPHLSRFSQAILSQAPAHSTRV